MTVDDTDPESLPEAEQPVSRADRLAKQILDDRARQAERQQERQRPGSGAEKDATCHDGPPTLPDAETTARVPVFTPHRRDGGEGSDDYSHVVAIIGEKTRVIVCNEGIQWIVQHRKGGQWRGQSFCRTREALLRCSGHPNHPVLLALPERIVERRLLGASLRTMADE